MDGGVIPLEMQIAIICDKMRWTLDEYLSQPEWFIKTLILKWSVESDHNKRQSGKK